MLSKARFKELEELWKRKRKSTGGTGAYVSITEIPADLAGFYRGPKRSPTVRGRDFVQELTRLAVKYSDRRFAQCVHALFELGIVNRQTLAFTANRGPHADGLKREAADQKRQRLASAVAKVRTLMSSGLSEREACAVVATDFVGARSFAEAVNQVRNASKKARKPVGKRARG